GSPSRSLRGSSPYGRSAYGHSAFGGRGACASMTPWQEPPEAASLRLTRAAGSIRIPILTDWSGYLDRQVSGIRDRSAKTKRSPDPAGGDSPRQARAQGMGRASPGGGFVPDRRKTRCRDPAGTGPTACWRPRPRVRLSLGYGSWRY